VALNTARLNAQVQEDRQQLQDLSRRLVEAQESERRSIAQELHDEAGQSLTSLMVGLSLLEREIECSERALGRITDLKQTAHEVMEGLHELAVNLRPASLDRVGLIPTLRQQAESFGRQHGVDVQFAVLGMEDERLPPQVETALYRVVQEALTNVARHAQASHVGVVLERRDDRVLAIIEDDGIGFDPDEVVRRDRLGLFGMRERAEMLGGNLTIESSPGIGTTVFVEVPCASAHTDS
jgi:signal transduction histidine kinase